MSRNQGHETHRDWVPRSTERAQGWRRLGSIRHWGPQLTDGQPPAQEEGGEVRLPSVNADNRQQAASDEEQLPPLLDPWMQRAERQEVQRRLMRLLVKKQPRLS